MKKYILFLLLFGSMFQTLAQTPGMMQRKMLPGKIDTLIINYFTYSKFSSLDDVGFSDAVANQFKNLFNANAKITDEVNPSYYDKDYDHPFDLPLRSMDEYLAKTKENYPSGLFVKYNAIQVDYSALTILLLKETNGTTKEGLLYRVTDTLRFKLTASPDLKTIKIQDIFVLGYTIALANDEDRDFIPNELDKCPKEQGFRNITGCFTKEEKAAYAIAEKERKRKEKEDNAVVKTDKDKVAIAKAEKERLQKEKEAKEAAAKNENNNTEKDLAAKAEKERLQKEKEAEEAAAKNDPAQAAAAKAEKERLQKEKEEGEAIAAKEKEERDALALKEKEERDRNRKPAEPGLFLGLTISGGNNKFETPFGETNLGYDQMIKGSKSVNSITGLKLNKQAPFTQIQLDIDYYFGSKRKFGIATGIGYSSFSASFGMDSFHVEYQSTDSKSNVFRKVLHVRSIDEDLKISSLNIPIILQYKFGLGDKANLALGLGVNYHNALSAKVTGSATADYEAIYNFKNGKAGFDSSVTPSRDSWLITRSNVEAHNGKSGEVEYFATKRADGYDVAIDQALNRDESLKLTGSFGVVLRLNANFKLSEKLWFATLLQFQSVSFTNNSLIKNYKLTDEIGTYNVLLNNVNTLKVSTVSLGIGLKFTIK